MKNAISTLSQLEVALNASMAADKDAAGGEIVVSGAGYSEPNGSHLLQGPGMVKTNQHFSADEVNQFRSILAAKQISAEVYNHYLVWMAGKVNIEQLRSLLLKHYDSRVQTLIALKQQVMSEEIHGSDDQYSNPNAEPTDSEDNALMSSIDLCMFAYFHLLKFLSPRDRAISRAMGGNAPRVFFGVSRKIDAFRETLITQWSTAGREFLLDAMDGPVSAVEAREMAEQKEFFAFNGLCGLSTIFYNMFVDIEEYSHTAPIQDSTTQSSASLMARLNLPLLKPLQDKGRHRGFASAIRDACATHMPAADLAKWFPLVAKFVEAHLLPYLFTRATHGALSVTRTGVASINAGEELEFYADARRALYLIRKRFDEEKSEERRLGEEAAVLSGIYRLLYTMEALRAAVLLQTSTPSTPDMAADRSKRIAEDRERLERATASVQLRLSMQHLSEEGVRYRELLLLLRDSAQSLSSEPGSQLTTELVNFVWARALLEGVVKACEVQEGMDVGSGKEVLESTIRILDAAKSVNLHGRTQP